MALIINKCLCSNMINFINYRKIGRIRTIFPRLLSYSAIPYDERDPAPLFFNKEVQFLLKELTRIDLAKVFRRRKLGEKQLKDPEYKFMTNEQLEDAMKEAKHKCDEMLQIPPVVSVSKPLNNILSRDPALEGLDSSRMVFTDITFGIKDAKRMIVVRESDGTLREAEWELRNRTNQIYFPKERRLLKSPRMFQENFLEDLLKREEYEFILDNSCNQFEPYDPEYQRVVTITYQYVNDNNGFHLLRSTRHFGGLVFFLVWNKNIDNFLLELIETGYIEDALKLLDLYCKIHNVILGTNNFDSVEDYIKIYSQKKGALELALQTYKELSKERGKMF